MSQQQLFKKSGPTANEQRAAFRKIMFTLTLPRQPRAVLRAIHDHAGLYPEFALSLKQIAEYLDVSVSTVRDAKNWLTRKELLIEKPRFRQSPSSRSPEQIESAFTISWFNVANTLPPETRADVLRMLRFSAGSEGGVVQTSEGVVQTSEGVVQISGACTFSSFLDSELENTLHCTTQQSESNERAQEDVPCGAVGFENGASEADANRSPVGGDDHVANSRRAIGQTSPKTSEVSETSEVSPLAAYPLTPSLSPAAGGRVAEGRVRGRRGNPWPFDVTAADLMDPQRLRRLFDAAVSRSWWIDSEQGRLSWATMCVYVAREAREPGKLLTICARSGKHDGTQADEAKARRLVEIAWSGIDSEEAECVLDAMTESEFRAWAIEHGEEEGSNSLDHLVLYGRGRGSSTRPRLIRVLAQELAQAAMT